MPISAYVLRFAATARDGVIQVLQQRGDVSLGEATEDGIAVVIDAPSTRAAETAGTELEAIPGVKAATLVYHNFEDVADHDDSPAQTSTTRV